MNLKIRRFLLILTAVLCYYTLLEILDTTCIILYFTNFPCPTCGTTRALISLMRLDFESYVKYNAMAPLLAAAFIASLSERCLRQKKVFIPFISVILTANTVYYILRLFGVL